MSIVMGHDGQFSRLGVVRGDFELSGDPQLASPQDRNIHRAELHPRLQCLLAARGAFEWFDLLSAQGLPCAPINDMASEIHLVRRIGVGPLVEIGPLRQPGVRHPIRLSVTAPPYLRTPPALMPTARRILPGSMLNGMRLRGRPPLTINEKPPCYLLTLIRR